MDDKIYITNSVENPEEIVTEKLQKEITDTINKKIIERIKEMFPYEYWEPEKRKKYEYKFEIKSTGDKEIPFNIQWFIHQKIEEDIHNGYIIRTYKDDKGKEYSEKISLDDLEKVIYVYDVFYDDKSIIRIHKYKNDNDFNGPVFAPYILSNDPAKICPHQNLKIKSKYSLIDLGFYPETKYVTFNITHE